MKKSKSGISLIVIGICLIIFYLVVRFFFLRDIQAVLAQSEVRSLEDYFSKGLSVYLYIWLLFCYSFKLGMLLIVIGGALIAGMEKYGIWLFIIGGLLYLSLCFVSIGYHPLFFGIQGVIIMLLFLLIVWYWTKKRSQLDKPAKTAGDLRIIGYYFFIVATHNLCGIFGIGSYVLKPDIMIKHGLLPGAVTMTSHVMIELFLGWLFIFLSMYKENTMIKE